MVVLLATCTLLAAVGITTVSVLTKEMPALTGYSASANTTLYSVYNNVYSGFSLSTVLPVVVIAGIIVSLFVGCFAAFKNSGVLVAPEV